MTQDLQKTIEDAWKNRINLTALSSSVEIREAISEVIDRLDRGTLRIAEKQDGKWHVNQWAKQAVLLSFRMEENSAVPVGATGAHAMHFHDRHSSQLTTCTDADFSRGGFRAVQSAVTRRGSYIGKNVVMMSSFVDIGAYVDEGAIIDAWATVGPCAQIGKHVHLSGGVGIGGVLEPIQANPTIIEDNCFIGARSEIVEGVIVEENSVIAMGVYIGRSTRIYDRENDRILYGHIPSGSVVVPGSLPAENGKYSLYCAVIIKRVDAQTRAKTAIHDLLREA